MASTTPPSWLVRSPKSRKVMGGIAFLLPLALFTSFISLDFTFGDGPELLVAIINQGGAHPSGYPLFTLLGQIPALLPWATPHANVAFWLAALPSAAACWCLYKLLVEEAIRPSLALLGACLFAVNDTVLNQGTKVEVYGLHSALLAGSMLLLGRYARDKTRQDLFWSGTLACLALTNHLTSALWILPFCLGAALVDWRAALRPRTWGPLTGIAGLTSLVYAYLPLHVSGAKGLTPSWNAPTDWQHFWYHVSGKEYAQYHDYGNLGPRLGELAYQPSKSFFPGIVLLGILGAVRVFRNNRTLALCLLLFVACLSVYVASYDISDISTYYGPFYWVGLFFAVSGFDWVVNLLLRDVRSPRSWLTLLVILTAAMPIGTLYNNRGEYYRDMLAEDMSDAVFAALPEKSIIFTRVDGHTFPLWYQSYVKAPQRQVVVVDRTMYRLPDKKWYRDFLRERHPNVRWPDEPSLFGTSRLAGGLWENRLLDDNPEYKAFSMLARPWDQAGRESILEGWHHRLERSAGPAKTQHTMHIYMARGTFVRNRTYFRESLATYPVGTTGLACVAEWWKHKEFDPTWTYRGPGGRVVNFKPHNAPSDALVSWEYLKPEEQVAGEWTCEVRFEGRLEAQTTFVLE